MRMETLGIILTFKLLLLFSQIFISKSYYFEKDLLLSGMLCDSESIDLGTARSVTSCGQYCLTCTMPVCKSFFFDKTNKQCKGISTILGSTAGCISMSSSVYYKTTGYTVNYGTGCTADSECTSNFTHCLQGSCQCKAGYSYLPNTESGSCVEECGTYGKTYIYFPNMLLDVIALAEHPNASLADCRKHCFYSSPLCRGFNYCVECGNLCRIKGDTPLSHSSHFISSPSFDYYFRNCA